MGHRLYKNLLFDSRKIFVFFKESDDNIYADRKSDF